MDKVCTIGGRTQPTPPVALPFGPSARGLDPKDRADRCSLSMTPDRRTNGGINQGINATKRAYRCSMGLPARDAISLSITPASSPGTLEGITIQHAPSIAQTSIPAVPLTDS